MGSTVFCWVLPHHPVIRSCVMSIIIIVEMLTFLKKVPKKAPTLVREESGRRERRERAIGELLYVRDNVSLPMK